MMTGRERFLTALRNEKPDRLPCQVHNWMDSYLRTQLGGRDAYEAYEFFGMDPVIYVNPELIYDPHDQEKWQEKFQLLDMDADGNQWWQRTITTPKGILTEKGAYNQYTGWITEHIIKSKDDFELWNEFIPIPVKVDWSGVEQAKKRIGETGIVRGSVFGFGQGSPWQDFSSHLFDMEEAIFSAMDDPDWMHHVLSCLLEKKLNVIEKYGKVVWDVVETGGGAASSTVISPAMFDEFCIPYDRQQHEALHAAGATIVYHLCGGLMPMLERVVENGADGLETMTPPEMGGDCVLEEATKRVGDKLFFVGGFDQRGGFENGTPDDVRQMVHRLHDACPNGGYIISPSDHFFEGRIENVRAFADAVKECTY